jgi:hypothetical protein
MSIRRRRLLLGLGLAVLGGASGVAAVALQDRFDHWEHAALFPTCLGCHAGVADTGVSLWPQTADCSACHDGTVEETVNWRPPAATPATNLRFTHPAHAKAVTGAHPDSTVQCRDCHAERGAERMRVQLAVVNNCLDCHGITVAHLDAPDTACATCHLPLVRAVRLTREDVGDFPVPESHSQPGFAAAQHGKLARAAAPIAASCATCHARDFCAECHVNAPEVPAIQALAPDPRSLAHPAELEAPASHQDPAFLRRHGAQARKSAATCATCHTQESCLACHAASPSSVQAIPAAAPGRGRGAQIERERPVSHGPDFSETHAEAAAARQQSCTTCHVRTECLSCHRPDPGAAAPGYHPAGFLSTHPASAYSRASSCTDCHNQAQFCADCHVRAGLTAPGQLRGAGYHDAKSAFLLNHGQAARQSLESCVSCHSERDCLPCHSARGGRRFNPHGPGFDAATLRRKNPSMCSVCHGASIPGG